MFGDTMTTDFAKLRAAAQKAAVNFRASEDCFVGSVGAALLAENGEIYTGACIDLPMWDRLLCGGRRCCSKAQRQADTDPSHDCVYARGKSTSTVRAL